MLAAQWGAAGAALRRHDATADTVAADATALADAEARLRARQLDDNQAEHALHRLLGLRPEADLRLAGFRQVPLLSADEYQAAVTALPRHRADLLALQAGYESQEQRVRAAILAQFPSLTAGVEQARSAEEGVHTTGVDVELSLPFFNRNRGRVAIARATRAELRQAYQARLDQAATEADQLWRATQILARQLHDAEFRLHGMRAAADAAAPSFQRDEMSRAAYVRLRSGYLGATADAFQLGSALAQAQSALRILLGRPFDAAPSP